MKIKNPFQNIKNSASRIAIQQEINNTITKKGRGRPPRPNMGKFLIKLDKILHKKIEKKAAMLGTSNSFIIAEALRFYFQKNN